MIWSLSLIGCLQVLSVETHLAGQLFPGNRKPVETSSVKNISKTLFLLATGGTNIYFLN
jgi:hypothetical protein